MHYQSDIKKTEIPSQLSTGVIPSPLLTFQHDLV